MTGQLCWIPKFGSFGNDKTLTLHLRLNPYDSWKPHTAYPGLCVPDYLISNGSKGWATSQKLIQAGWVCVPTKEARRTYGNDSIAA